MTQTNLDITTQPDGSASSIMEYVYLLWHWAWLILLAGALAGGAAYYNSSHTIPTYSTSIRLFISVPNISTNSSSSNQDSSNLFYSDTLTATYAQMLTDYPVLQGVVEKLNLKTNPDQLGASISASEVTGTQLIDVSVAGTDPNLIIAVANALGAVFSDRIATLQSARFAASEDALSKQVADMGAQVDSTTAALANQTDPAQQSQLETRLTDYKQLYTSLLYDYETVRMAEAENTTNVIVANPARYVSQTGPNTRQNTLLAVVVGMLLAIGVIFVIDFLDDTIKNPDEVRVKFNLPILGVISSYKIPEGKTIAQYSPRSPVTEAFRGVRTNITYAAVDHPLRRIMITSPSPQDGKTTVVTNLAVVMAQGGKTVALVDADLHRPQIHKRLNLTNRRGLTDLFVNPLDEISSFTQANEVHGLTIITSGALPPNPAELLTSHKMSEILDRLNQDSDLVLIDTPPVLTVTDAASLATSMDGVIVVAKPGVTTIGALKQTLEQLHAVGAKILGVVLNEVEPRSQKYGYYYHRYYSKYSYYYSAEGEKKRTSRKEAGRS